MCRCLFWLNDAATGPNVKKGVASEQSHVRHVHNRATAILKPVDGPVKKSRHVSRWAQSRGKVFRDVTPDLLDPEHKKNTTQTGTLAPQDCAHALWVTDVAVKHSAAHRDK